ncbi:MAG TPA: hypothetical protein PKE47_01480, partial [Verrucomicrobiota bacterium]|nr:hypothetical protein [Verrucomicrobiota bacterium]
MDTNQKGWLGTDVAARSAAPLVRIAISTPRPPFQDSCPFVVLNPLSGSRPPDAMILKRFSFYLALAGVAGAVLLVRQQRER